MAGFHLLGTQMTIPFHCQTVARLVGETLAPGRMIEHPRGPAPLQAACASAEEVSDIAHASLLRQASNGKLRESISFPGLEDLDPRNDNRIQ